MSEHIDVAMIDPEGREYISVPEGYRLCLISDEHAERLAEWQECAAVRVVSLEYGMALFEVTTDLDALTAPGAGDGS